MNRKNPTLHDPERGGVRAIPRRLLLQSGLALCAFSGTALAAAAPADLALQAYRLLASLEAPLLAPFLGAWPATTARRHPAALSVPVIRWLPAARDGAPPFSAAFVRALLAAAPTLAWRRTYTVAEVGAAFLDGYGWSELVGLSGPVPAQRLACGVLLLAPGVTYPPHHHEADEIYVPLSGTAEWRQGAQPWELRAPGSVIHHAPNQSHAMRTGATPLLALYLWHSDDLAQKSHLDTAADPG